MKDSGSRASGRTDPHISLSYPKIREWGCLYLACQQGGWDFAEELIHRVFSQVRESLPFYHSGFGGHGGQLSFIPLWKMEKIIVLQTVHAAENEWTKWS